MILSLGITVSDVQPSDALSTSEKSGQALPLSFYLVRRLLLLNHVFCINSVYIVFFTQNVLERENRIVLDVDDFS